MTGFYPGEHKVIHNGWGLENVDNRGCGRAVRSTVAGRFRSRAQGSGVRGSNDLREGGSDRYCLGFEERLPSLVGPPSLTSRASCMDAWA